MAIDSPQSWPSRFPYPIREQRSDDGQQVDDTRLGPKPYSSDELEPIEWSHLSSRMLKFATFEVDDATISVSVNLEVDW